MRFCRTSGSSAIAMPANRQAIVPFDLPPIRPALAIDGTLEHRLQEAQQALVGLDLAGEMLPSLDWFIYAFVRKEESIPHGPIGL
jgi:hypothetical protein